MPLAAHACAQRELDVLFIYLATNPSLGITYAHGPSTFHGMCDASWETRNSTFGWITLWQRAALTWGSRKQHSIALSSCEAEIVALSEGAKDAVYLRRFLSGLSKSYIVGPTDLATDNTGARDTSYNPVNHDRMKHVARRHYFIRDMVEALELQVPFVPTKENVADFFTKPLAEADFLRFRDIIMNITRE